MHGSKEQAHAAARGKRTFTGVPFRTAAGAFAINMALALLTAGVVGPSIVKLEGLFGLVGFAARMPFYLLPLYLAPAVLWLRPRIRGGVGMGGLLALPLLLWSVATRCSPVVGITYLASGAAQGALLAWWVRRDYSRTVGEATRKHPGCRPCGGKG